MDFPRDILIGDGVWKVRKRRIIEGNEGLLGLCDPETQTIWVKTGQTYIETWKTLFHEVLHAYEYEDEIELGHPVIEAVEGFFARFFVDNIFG